MRHLLPIDNYPFLDIYYPCMDREQSSLFSQESYNPRQIILPESQPLVAETPIEKAVNRIFTTDKEQNKFDKARRILGESGKEITDEQLENYISEFEYLASCWLEIFERQTFEGRTLNEILRAK